jgi:hypothetical protein
LKGREWIRNKVFTTSDGIFKKSRRKLKEDTAANKDHQNTRLARIFI